MTPGAMRTSPSATEPLYGTDVLLAVILGLTTIDLSIQVGGFPLGLGDALLIPVLFALLLSPARATMPWVYTAFVWAYLLWCVLTLFWSADTRQALGPLLQYIEFFFLVPLAFSHVRNLRGALTIVRAYVLCTSVLSLAVIVYASTTATFSHVYFLNYQKNLLGAITGNALPLIIGLLVIGGARRWTTWVALILTVAALLLSSSRGAMLGALIGLAVFLLLTRRVRYGLVLGLVGLTMFFVYITWISPEATVPLTDFSPDSSAYSRLIIFSDAMRVISESPVVGHGVGSYLIEIPSIGFSQRDPSNVFLLTLAEGGLVGLALFVGILVAIASLAKRNATAFRDRPQFLALSAALAGGFASHLAHIQLDVSWVRGTGTFVFACVGLMMKLRSIAEDRPAGSLVNRLGPGLVHDGRGGRGR